MPRGIPPATSSPRRWTRSASRTGREETIGWATAGATAERHAIAIRASTRRLSGARRPRPGDESPGHEPLMGRAIRTSAVALFWGSASLLAYVYLGYPALVRAWSGLRPRPVRRGRDEPSVTVVVVAHNEEAEVAERIENVLTQDYPSNRLEMVLASDGSTDGTVARARAYEPAGV